MFLLTLPTLSLHRTVTPIMASPALPQGELSFSMTFSRLNEGDEISPILPTLSLQIRNISSGTNDG